MKKLVLLVVALLCATTLAGCSGGKPKSTEPTPSSSKPSSSPTEAQTGTPTGTPTAKPADKTAATLVKSGFGQSGQFVWVTSLVHNDSKAVGQTVTVHYDLLDASGARVKKADAMASFSRVGEDLAVGAQVAVRPGIEVASVNARMTVKYTGSLAGAYFPALTVSNMKVVKAASGSWTMQFDVANPTARPVQSPRIGVICFNGKGKIIGGASDYPARVPAKGKTAVRPAGAIVSGKPAKCEAYVGPPM